MKFLEGSDPVERLGPPTAQFQDVTAVTFHSAVGERLNGIHAANTYWHVPVKLLKKGEANV